MGAAGDPFPFDTAGFSALIMAPFNREPSCLCHYGDKQEETAVINAAIASLSLLVTCVLIHYEFLSALKVLLRRMTMIPRRAKMLFVFLGAIISHILQIGLFAAAYFLLRDKFDLGGFGGSFMDSFSNFLYFSAETYTSLGLGDIFPTGDLRMLAGMEALTGLVMISWTASFSYLEMTQYWLDPPAKGTPR